MENLPRDDPDRIALLAAVVADMEALSSDWQHETVGALEHAPQSPDEVEDNQIHITHVEDAMDDALAAGLAQTTNIND